MENLPDNLDEDYSKLNLTDSSASNSVPATVIPPPEVNMISRWIEALHNRDKVISGFALQQLASNRIKFPEISEKLWDSHCTVAMMLQEVVRIYPYISLPVFSQQGMPHRVYNILLLFQYIACHPKTKEKFLKAKLAHYVYPLMDIGYVDKPFEYLRVGALGVVAHMLKELGHFTYLQPVDAAAVRFLMDTGALHYCAKAVEVGRAESKKLAVYILEKILWTNEGLQYCCVLADRFFVINGLLKNLLVYISSTNESRSTLFHLVISCYARLSQKSRARDGLRRYIPVMLFNGTFTSLLADPVADYYRKQLIQNLNQ